MFLEVELLHEHVDVQFNLKIDQNLFYVDTVRMSTVTTSCSKNFSFNVLSPGLLPESSDN